MLDTTDAAELIIDESSVLDATAEEASARMEESWAWDCMAERAKRRGVRTVVKRIALDEVWYVMVVLKMAFLENTDVVNLKLGVEGIGWNSVCL